MITETDRKEAVELLQRVSELDPLYKPASFFLAYASLQAGDVELAAQMFAEINAQ